MADLLDTPSRVLKRLQQYDEMELPSLPSFQHGSLDLSDDYDLENSQDSMASATSERGHYSTPHIARAQHSPHTASSARTESTVRPLRSSATSVPTPVPEFRPTNLLPNSELDISHDSFFGGLSASDTSAAAADELPTRHAYDDYSSMSERLPAPSAGSQYYDGTEEYQPSLLATTMLRPSRRSVSPFLAAENTPKAGNEPRIPSLSRSEVSSTDNEATTPEGRDPLQLPSIDPCEPSKIESSYDLSADNLTSARSPSPIILNSPEATPVVIRYMDQPSTAARAAATPFGTAPLRDVTTRYRNQRPPSPSVEYPNSSRAPLDDTVLRKAPRLSVLASNSLPSRPSPLRSALAPQSSLGSSSGTARSNGTSTRPNDGGDSVLGRSSSGQSDDLGGSNIHECGGSLSASEARLSHANTSAGSTQHLDSMSPFAKIQRHLNKMDQQLLDSSSEAPEDWREERRRLVNIIQQAGLDIDTHESDHGTAFQDQMSSEAGPSEFASLRAELQDARDELASVKSDFTRKTEEHYNMFTEIGADYAKQIEALQDELGRAKGEGTRLQTQLDMLRPSSAVQEDELRKQIAILGGDLSRAQEDAQVVAEALENAQARLSEAHANEKATLQQLQEAEDYAETLQSELDSAKRDANLGTRRAEDLQNRLTVAVEKMQALQSQLDSTQREGTLAANDHEELRNRLVVAESEAETVAKDRAQRLTLLETRLTDAETLAEDRAFQVNAAMERVSSLEERVSSLEDENHTLQLEKEASSQQVTSLERQQLDDKDVISDQRKIIDELEEEIATSRVEAKTSKNRIDDLEGFLSAAQATQASSQAELESLKNQLEIAKYEATEADETRDITVASSPDVAAVYEEQLEEAHRRIGRLKAELEAMPARHKTLEDRDARIHALETEKEALLERLKAREVASPARWANSMRTSTPVFHKAVSALRSPRTPGPLKDMSWLQSTMDDSNESLLRAQLDHLQLELDAANNQLDKNFDRLEEAGLGAVRLAELLAEARAKLDEYNDELVMQGRVNQQKEASLVRGRHKNERLETALDEVHQRLSSLRENMTAEKERLQEDNRRLRLQLSDMRLKYDEELERLSEETARVHEEAQEDISQSAKRHEQVCKDMEVLSAQLRKSEALVAQRDREASKLHSSIGELNVAIDKLRQQVVTTSKAQDKARSLQTSLDEVRSSLLSSQEDATRLRNDLRLRSDEVANKEREIETLTAERQRITRELAQFGDDLAVQRRECTAFGSELQLVRTEQTSSRRAHADELARLDDNLRTKQADLMRATQLAEETRHQCSALQQQLARADTQAQTTAEQRQKFKAQMRRLSAQIEYLKAVYARENTFRNALALQKKFLILCVGGMSLNEQATLRAIASMGYGVSPPARPKRSLKSVGLAVLSLVRAKRMAEQWQATRMKRSTGIKRD